MSEQINLLDVAEHHSNGPDSEKESEARRKPGRVSKALAVHRLLEQHNNSTAGELWKFYGHSLRQFKIYDIYDLRRSLYILKKTGKIIPRLERKCWHLGVNTIEWAVAVRSDYEI